MYLKHHGILGQKWGIRRFQNKDGTLTDEGKKRYAKYIANASYDDMRFKKDLIKKDVLYDKESINELASIKNKESELDNKSKAVLQEYFDNEYKIQSITGIAYGYEDDPTVEGMCQQGFGYMSDDYDQGYGNSIHLYAYKKGIIDEATDLQKQYIDNHKQRRDATEKYVDRFIGEYGNEPVGSSTSYTAAKKIVNELTFDDYNKYSYYIFDAAFPADKIPKTTIKYYDSVEKIVNKLGVSQNSKWDFWDTIYSRADDLGILDKDIMSLTDDELQKLKGD